MNNSRVHIASRVVLAITIVITLVCLYTSRDLKFDYDFEKFFPQDDPGLEYYHSYRKNFEYDNEFALIAIENKQGVFDQQFLKRVKELTDSLKTIRNITNVISVTNLKTFVIAPLGIIEVPYLHIDEPERYKQDSIDIYSSHEPIRSFFSDDARSVSVYVKTKEGIAKLPSDTLLQNIQNSLAKYHFDHTRIVGKIKAQKVYVDQIQHEFSLFLISSFILVVLFLYISFRSWWGILLPVMVVVISVIWLLGIIHMLGNALDIMTVLLPTMVFVVGMSDVVHITTKYLEEQRNGKDSVNAFKATLRDVGFPTLLTLVTTAIGFLTLLFSSNIEPVKNFGIYTSLGALIAFVLSFVFYPAALMLIKKPLVIKESNESTFWNKILHRLFLWVMKKRKIILVSMIFALVISGVGISKMVINNSLLEDIVDEDELKEDFAFFEKHYSGVRPFELALQLNGDEQVYSREVLTEVDKIENYLRNEYGVGFMFSPLTTVKLLNKALNGGVRSTYNLPSDSAGFAEVMNYINKMKKRPQLKKYADEELRVIRISGKMADLGSRKVKVLNEKFDEWFKTNIDQKKITYRLTGAAEMVDRNNEYLSINMMMGVCISILVVALIIGLIHRSAIMCLIGLLPNVIPLLLVAGFMGFTGIELKISTSIIFSIAFGIATDDTIHFLARFKLELDKGRSLLYALKRTYLSTGKAVVVTSLILTGGFLSLILSSFESTFYFGALVALILFIAVLVDLLLLPPLLLYLFRKK